MKLLLTVVGEATSAELGGPVDLPRVPMEGEQIHVPQLDKDLYVRTVIWYPWGNTTEDPEDTEPFVYVVIGPRRPH